MLFVKHCPRVALEVFRRRPAGFAKLVLGQFRGSSFSKGCGVAATFVVYNGTFAPLHFSAIEVLHTANRDTAQDIPPADDLVGIIIHNIQVGGICKDLMEQDTHF